MNKNYDEEISNALCRADARDLLEYFRQDTSMTETEFYFFCKRYCSRNASTVADFIREMYGKSLTQKNLKEAMSDFLENCMTETVI